jgi:hypothetical protein
MAGPAAAGSPAKPPSKQQAIASVDRHVFPKACFVWFKSTKDGWTPIPGTGCAHYVAHQLGMKGTGGVCDAGYLFRVPALVTGLSPIKAGDAAVGDIWANARLTHTGLVVEVEDDGTKGRDIVIEHCSSQQGGVVRNDWRTHFSAQGQFYRPAGAATTPLPQDKASARTSRLPVRETFV